MKKVEFEAKIVKPEEKELKAMGWPKSHVRLDVNVGGKWRAMGYFKDGSKKGIDKVCAEAIRKMSVNIPMPAEMIQLKVDLPEWAQRLKQTTEASL